MSKYSPQQLQQLVAGVENDLYNQVYLPIFQKTAMDLGVPINSEADLVSLAELALALRPADAEKTASENPYARLLNEVRTGVKTAGTLDISRQAQAYVGELVKDPEFIKLAKLSQHIAEEAQKLA